MGPGRGAGLAHWLAGGLDALVLGMEAGAVLTAPGNTSVNTLFPHLLLGDAACVGNAGHVLEFSPLCVSNFQIWKFEFVPNFFLDPCHPQENRVY